MRPTTSTSASLPAVALPSVGTALRVVESLLLSGGQRTARRNAWTAVQEDRRRARDRVEAQHVLEAVSGRTSEAASDRTSRAT
ncbi:hypothetical protein [Streptomyces sp. SID3212]|uniref:SCO2195 family GlnR-regulated protein n=1 Tax=Streptomyces sp. SID3212 TaxID=2690259 RepID=UPI001367FC73|nr:hypothetical protein [Streptomyces sp. SID3212]